MTSIDSDSGASDTRQCIANMGKQLKRAVEQSEEWEQKYNDSEHAISEARMQLEVCDGQKQTMHIQLLAMQDDSDALKEEKLHLLAQNQHLRQLMSNKRSEANLLLSNMKGSSESLEELQEHYAELLLTFQDLTAKYKQLALLNDKNEKLVLEYKEKLTEILSKQNRLQLKIEYYETRTLVDLHCDNQQLRALLTESDALYCSVEQKCVELQDTITIHNRSQSELSEQTPVPNNTNTNTNTNTAADEFESESEAVLPSFDRFRTLTMSFTPTNLQAAAEADDNNNNSSATKFGFYHAYQQQSESQGRDYHRLQPRPQRSASNSAYLLGADDAMATNAAHSQDIAPPLFFSTVHENESAAFVSAPGAMAMHRSSTPHSLIFGMSSISMSSSTDHLQNSNRDTPATATTKSTTGSTAAHDHDDDDEKAIDNDLKLQLMLFEKQREMQFGFLNQLQIEQTKWTQVEVDLRQQISQLEHELRSKSRSRSRSKSRSKSKPPYMAKEEYEQSGTVNGTFWQSAFGGGLKCFGVEYCANTVVESESDSDSDSDSE